MAGLIAVDPGTRLCGYFIWWDGKPYAAGVARSKAGTASLRAREMAHAIDFATPASDASRVVVERPVIYPNSRERDSDQIDLAVAAGIIGGTLSALYECELIMPTPREWKGSVPKHIHNERTRAKCPEAVALVEANVPKGQQNHVWDAVGLALWQLERTK